MNILGVVSGVSFGPVYYSFQGIRADNLKTYSGPGDQTFTWAEQINNFGVTTGTFNDNTVNGVVHGFLRTPDGIVTAFDVPDAGKRCCWQGTWGASINDAGVITGAYTDTNWVAHGYVRYRR
jgi:hypothetical protein